VWKMTASNVPSSKSSFRPSPTTSSSFGSDPSARARSMNSSEGSSPTIASIFGRPAS
jgi:hypothetical protein